MSRSTPVLIGKEVNRVVVVFVAAATATAEDKGDDDVDDNQFTPNSHKIHDD